MARVITPLRQTQHHPRDWAESTAGNHITNNDLGVFVLQGDNSSECVTPAPTLTAEQIVANLITKDDGVTHTETDQYGNAYAGYQAGIQDGGNCDTIIYGQVATGLPDALIEDPAWTPATVLVAHRDRVTWDAPIRSVADVGRLPFAPRMLNVKPSRLGSVRALFAFYEHCEQAGIGRYGGGQFELGPGRRQIQRLASLFHPDAPNDVAPGAYQASAEPAGRAACPRGIRMTTRSKART